MSTRRVGALMLAAVAWGCAAERGSDDRWTGRWSRSIGSAQSELALWQAQGEWRACWTQSIHSPGDAVRCRDGGGSEVVRDGAAVYVYDARVVPLEDGALELEVHGRPAPGVPGTEIRWKDRLVLEPGTDILLVYPFEMNGKPRPAGGAPLRFSKQASG